MVRRLGVRVAYITILTWLVAILILSMQALELDKRLVYSEEPFLPRESESYRGLQILRGLGYATGDTLLIIYSPSDLNTSIAVEEAVNVTLKELGVTRYDIKGPYSVYKSILGFVEGNLSSAIMKALESYRNLTSLGFKAREAYESTALLLRETYGLAESFLKAYYEARERGLEDPSSYAYEYLKARLPADKLILLEGFYRFFKNYEGKLKPEDAARRALIDMAKAYKPEVVRVLEAFDLSNYSNPRAIALYVYNVGGVRAYNISLDDFQRILEDPERGALDYVARRLSELLDPCAARALSEVLEGASVREAVSRECSAYINSIARYPDVIPVGVRKLMLSQDYGVTYVYFNETISIDFSRRLLRTLEDRLRSSTREAYFHGTLTLFADLGENTEREVRRIDFVTVALVVGLLVILLGSIASPIVIVVSTAASLVVSLGLLSVVAAHTNVYYLARVVMIPVVFGITVDYSVFYLFRVVEERARGYDWVEAVYHAWRRAGRALILGGISVVLGFLAYILTPQEALRGIGLALTIAAATSFLSSYTLLPAILVILGENRVFWPTKSIRFTARWQGALLRRLAGISLKLALPITLLVLAFIGGSLAYLASKPPSANVHLGLPPSSRFLEASTVLYTEFPRESFSRVYIVTQGNVDLGRLIEELRTSQLVAGDAIIDDRMGYRVANVGLPVDPLDDRLFDIIPAIKDTLRSATGDAILTGFASLRVDAINTILVDYFTITLPLAVTLIVLYLMAGMGSILIPLRLIVTVAFSATLSLVASTIAFHYLTEAPAYGSHVRSPIYWVTPIIVLGLMVTLGMDYDIFLTSRIREEYERENDHNKAILEAVEKTGVVITVCGLILAGAFSSLLLTETPVLRQIGFTVALSILVDTFIVRPIIVPAIMTLAGKYNWWPGKGLIRRWD